jgi:hypothetical protein
MDFPPSGSQKGDYMQRADEKSAIHFMLTGSNKYGITEGRLIAESAIFALL